MELLQRWQDTLLANPRKHVKGGKLMVPAEVHRWAAEGWLGALQGPPARPAASGWQGPPSGWRAAFRLAFPPSVPASPSDALLGSCSSAPAASPPTSFATLLGASSRSIMRNGHKLKHKHERRDAKLLMALVDSGSE